MTRGILATLESFVASLGILRLLVPQEMPDLALVVVKFGWTG